MAKVGILVNPDAGLGGQLAFKGSDGMAKEARDAGAEDRSGPRMSITLSRMATMAPLRLKNLNEHQFLICGGVMGTNWLPSDDFWGTDGVCWRQLTHVPMTTSAQDTHEAVRLLVGEGVDLILYAGGDGTTRDIVNTLEEIGAEKTGMIGVPGGVKMHSGCFATDPNGASEVLIAWLEGGLDLGITEVMDLDEEKYRQGEWVVKMYGEAYTPSSPKWIQGAKEMVQGPSEEEAMEALADHIREEVEAKPKMVVIWGSGGTLRTISSHLGFKKTVLGIDATRGGEFVGRDLSAQGMLDLFDEYGIGGDTDNNGAEDGEGSVLLLLSPMGGQGFLIGRGNLQLSPNVLKRIGLDSIIGVVTPAKLMGLDFVRIDTGDEALDDEFRQRKYVRLLQGYRTTRITRVAL